MPNAELLLGREAEDVAQAIVDGAVSPERGCEQMDDLRREMRYRDLIPPFDAAAWSSLDAELTLGSYRVLKGAAWNAAVRREARRFLHLQPELEQDSAPPLARGGWRGVVARLGAGFRRG